MRLPVPFRGAARQQGKTGMEPSDALSCKEMVELVTAYFEDALPPVERAQFEEHLASCSDCRTYLDQMRRTIGLAGQLTVESITGSARDQLLATFRDWKAR